MIITTGQERGALVRPDPAAHLVAVHPGHHDVEQHHVDVLLGEEPRAPRSPPRRGQHGAAARAQHRVEQPEVLRLVVDGEDRDVRSIGLPPRPSSRAHLPGQGAHPQRLLEVAVEPVAQRPRPVLGHRERRHRDDGTAGVVRGADPAQRLRPVDAGQLEVHQHQVGALLGGEPDAVLPGGRLDDAVARRAEHVADQLEVEGVVLDHEDRRPVRRCRVTGPPRRGRPPTGRGRESETPAVRRAASRLSRRTGLVR